MDPRSEALCTEREDNREIELEIDRLEHLRRAAEAAAAAYVRARTAAARRGARALAAHGGGLRTSRAELARQRSELSRRLERIAGIPFATPCEAAPLAFAFAAAQQTLVALDRLHQLNPLDRR